MVIVMVMLMVIQILIVTVVFSIVNIFCSDD